MINFALADCEFIVSNYSDQSINLEAGFLGSKSTKFMVRNSSQNSVLIKNDATCDGELSHGAYINLVGEKSKGGWVYVSNAKMYRAVGRAIGSDSGVEGLSPNGTRLILYNNYAPKSNTFEVRVGKADRNISRQFGSMN